MRYFAERLRRLAPAFRTVGEDEADPRNGSISYVSPVARALIGRSVGEIVLAGGQEIEILSID
jgi:transcription elongation GreA/GreB family factor